MLAAGTRVAGRYDIIAYAASGGQAAVYRAHDRQTGEQVAIKVLGAWADADWRERFGREASLLAALEHPRIVRYVSAGTLEDETPFLAMQWLDGETLAQRLKRGALTPQQASSVVASVAEGITLAHERGMVHRDLKPANVMLVGGNLDAAVVLDFGLARPISGSAALTLTGMLVGTAGYMSPEQLRDPSAVDRRSDVFALGCILYQCLMGEAAYSGAVPVAIGRILFDATPIVSAPHVPEDLVRLTAAMMSKVPGERPASAGHVLRALESPTSFLPPPSVRGVITNRERRRASLLLLKGLGSTASPTDDTLAQSICPPEILDAAIAPYGARAQLLGTDLAVVLMPGQGAAVDQALQAVRCALALRVVATCRVTVVTGQAEADVGVALGELFGRAVALDQRMRDAGVRIDDVTGNLVGERFEQVPDGELRLVVAERLHGEPTRRLLGRPTPFVGREREIATLEGVAGEAFAEPVARIAVVMAEAGVGKSRLRAELVARLRAAHPSVQVWSAGADARTVSSPFGLLRALLADVFGLQTGEPADQTRAKITSRLALCFSPGELADHAPFFFELFGANDPAHEEDVVKLRAARLDSQTMADQTRAAFVRLVAAETATRSVLVVIDDTHWADEASCASLERVARALADRPLAMFVFARPELRSGAARLTESHVEVELGPLSPRAAERVVRVALPGVNDDDAQSIVRRASGNAFFLEELVRAHSHGAAHTDTVVTALQAGIEALDVEARRFLRAASIIGEVFWLGAVAQLVGEQAATLLDVVDRLVDQEVLVRFDSSRYAGQAELAFRHALLRDAAFAMVPGDDRRLGHALLGRWLEGVGERDARLIADHLELGGDARGASKFWLRAAVQALDADACRQAADLATRALAHATDERATALQVRAEAVAPNDPIAGLDAVEESARAQEQGSSLWYRAHRLLLHTAMRLGRHEVARTVAREMLDAPLAPDSITARIALVEAPLGTRHSATWSPHALYGRAAHRSRFRRRARPIHSSTRYATR